MNTRDGSPYALPQSPPFADYIAACVDSTRRVALAEEMAYDLR